MKKKTLSIRMAALLCALIFAAFGQTAVFAETDSPSDAVESEKAETPSSEKADDAEPGDDASTDDAASSKAGRVLFLLYHNIAAGDTLGEKNDPNWCTTAAKLEADIDALWEMGYRSLSCADYCRGNYDKNQDYFVLTFDDGYLSNYELLPDILEKTGTYADIFMCTECTNLSNHFKYSQARRMKEGGLIRLYSHFNTHVYINELEKDDLLRGLKSSFAYLEKRLGETDLFFAYPHSSYSEETISALYDFGVRLQFVQFLPPASYTLDWQSCGLTLRYTVAYDTDMAAAAEEYFALLAASEGTSAADETSETEETGSTGSEDIEAESVEAESTKAEST